MLATPHLGERPHPVVASAARELLNKSENERSGVLSTTMSFLGLYRDPVVAKVTGRSDWHIRDLVEGVRPISLYLVVPPSDIARTKPLMRLVLNQIGRRLTESLDTDRRRQKLLLMLDEFAALGRLDFFESQLAFMAGYGIRSFLITQSLNQLERAYGANHAILDNCHIRIAFSTNDERTAKRVSDALGTATEMRAMKNYAGHRLSPWLGHLMVSRQETSRPLLTPGEVMQLSPNEAIVMVSGMRPVRAHKVRYYEDPQFQSRILKPSYAVLIDTTARTDAWSGRTPIPPSAKLFTILKNKVRHQNAGIRREPELPQQEEVVLTPPLAENEFDAVPDEGDTDAVQAAALNRSMQGLARSVSLDPDDKMGL
jgi:type IV secretion system protein VirD4